MTKKIITLLIFISSFGVCAQTANEPTPTPGCPGIDSMGLNLPNGQNTQDYVTGFGDDGTGCGGNASSIGLTPLNPGEFAYAQFDADVIRETYVNDTDYWAELSGFLAEMPIGGRVTIVEMYAADRLVADIALVKKQALTISSSGYGSGISGNSQTPSHRWRLIIKWYGATVNEFVVDKYFFAADERVLFNHVLETNAYGQIDQYISLNVGEYISTNPYTNSGLSHDLETYNMGFIDTNVQLVHGDRVRFNVNWIFGPNPL
ncbi:hypothetical protein [Marinicella meishanensis]|uniref:hypothetical protein n=1 Tax=Marinicella meishanensis TaxID=2873263 RepID=UPI001CBB6B57|nr:hypothetical protein [Marinicella sp. NBU2979]